MKVTLSQEQKKIKIHLAPLRKLAIQLAECAQNSKRDTPPWREVVIHLIDNKRMEEINHLIIGHEGATDVVTQQYEPFPGEPEGLIGELFVDVEWAEIHYPHRKQWDLEHEILLYIAHGCDHLSGEDDLTIPERRRMRRRELSWLKKIANSPFSFIVR